MKIYVAALLLGIVGRNAQGQHTSCHQSELSTKQLSSWISRAQSKAEMADVLCYLHFEENRYKGMAEEEDAALQYAYEHPIGTSKYPSAAAHARTFKARYKESAVRYAHLAEQLETRERQHDVPAS